MKKYYLAYGSNLNLYQMGIRCSSSNPIGTAILKDYRLSYKGSRDDYAYLTIEKSEGSYVPLGIFEISFFDEIALNRYEGYPEIYYKDYINIEINGKIKKGLIYIMNSEFGYYLPSKQYVDICMQGYEDFGFDKQLLNEAFEYSKENKIKNLLK